MPTTYQERSGDDTHRHPPLALHIRAKRQWYPRRELTQDELAQLADVSTRQLRRLERARQLPEAVDSILRLAMALSLSIEELIALSIVADRWATIEERRQRLKLADPENGHQPQPPSYATTGQRS